MTPARNLIAIAASVLLLLLLTLLLKRTTLGIALRAAATRFAMTRMLGVPANLIVSVALPSAGYWLEGWFCSGWAASAR